MQLLQCTATLPLPGGGGQCNLCNALPHCPGSVGSATPAIHCRTALGQWAVQLLQCTASLPGGSGQWAVELLQCTASLPGESGRCNFYNARPHCLGPVGSGTPAMHCLTALGAVGSGSPAMQCLTAWGQWVVQLLQCTASAWGQWAVELLQCTASLPGGSGQCNSCNALPHCPGGSGQCNSCNALPRCLGAVGSGTPAMHCPTAWGQWAAQLLQCTASLPWGSGQRNSCNALPHCLGAVGSATPAMHCLTDWAHRPGGMGSPAQGVVGASFRAYGGPSSSENRAHRPGGDGESRPGGGRSLLQGPWGGVIC